MRTVVKIGGSLATDPDRLRATLGALAAGAHGPCVIVPGGGAFADAVRAAQAAEGFSDAEAHRRALDAMGRMAAFFCGLEPRLSVTVAPMADAPPPPSAGEGTPRSGGGEGQRDGSGCDPRRDLSGSVAPLSRTGLTAGPPSPAGGGGSVARVWDPVLLRSGHTDIEESWSVTSDSLALWLAARIGARTCVLVKSADAPPGLDLAGLVRSGLVDAAFPAFAARFAGAITVWGPGGPVPVVRRAAA